MHVDERDQHLLSFIVPNCKFVMKRAAMGEKNSGEALNSHSRCLLVGLEKHLKIFDNVPIHRMSINKLYEAGNRLLWNATRSNWKFSLSKAKCSANLTYC